MVDIVAVVVDVVDKVDVVDDLLYSDHVVNVSFLE